MSTSEKKAALQTSFLSRFKEKQRANISTLTSFGGLIIVFLVFALTTKGSFASMSNLQLVLSQSVIIIIAGLGTTFVMAHGNMDFSLGGEAVLICTLAHYAIRVNPLLLVPACIIAGILLSAIIAMLHNILKLPTFVLGLCMMFMGRGVIKIVLSNEIVIQTPEMYARFDQSHYYIILMVIVIAVAYFLFEKTKIGKYNKAVGSSAKAAALSGIPVGRYKLFAFMITGVTLGLVAIIYMIKTGGITRSTGNMLEIDVLIALVLGGMPLGGGSSVKIRMIVIGSLLLAIMSNGMIIWGLDPVTVNIVKAIIFLGAVGLSYDRSSGYIS